MTNKKHWHLIADLRFLDSGGQPLLDAVEEEGQLLKGSSEILGDVRLERIVVLLLCVLPQAVQCCDLHPEFFVALKFGKVYGPKIKLDLVAKFCNKCAKILINKFLKLLRFDDGQISINKIIIGLYNFLWVLSCLPRE